MPALSARVTPRQIEHDVPVSLAEQVLHPAFEFFGWAAGHRILLRREHEPGTRGLMSGKGHV